MNKKISNDSTKIAGRVYDPCDYQQNDTLSKALAETHEQFSDSFMAGEIGGVINNKNVKNSPIPKDGNAKK